MFGWLRRLFRSKSPAPKETVTRGQNDKPQNAKPRDTNSRNAKPAIPDSPIPDSPIPNLPNPSPEPTVPKNDRRQLPHSEPASRSRKPQQKSALDDLKPVLSVLRAYVVTFGQPESEMELRAVVGAIVANLSEVTVENAELEGFTDEAIAAFKSLGVDPILVDVGSQLLAEQVAVWWREQEAVVTNVISAYIQQFAPDGADWKTAAVTNLAQNVVATLNDGSLSRSSGRVLVDRVVASFDLEKALSRWIAPEWIALAQRVANYIEKGDLQAELHSIAWAYVKQFQAILSPQLIERIMTEGSVTVTPEEFFSGSLTDFSQMLYYKFQLLKSEPEVTKSHIAIAADVRKAVMRHKKQQPPGLDVTKGERTGDLEIRSPFSWKRRK